MDHEKYNDQQRIEKCHSDPERSEGEEPLKRHPAQACAGS
jgi:hypothetical protein